MFIAALFGLIVATKATPSANEKREKPKTLKVEVRRVIDVTSVRFTYAVRGCGSDASESPSKNAGKESSGLAHITKIFLTKEFAHHSLLARRPNKVQHGKCR